MSKLLFCLAIVGLLGGCSHGLSVKTPRADSGSDGFIASFAADGGSDGFVAPSGADAGSPRDAIGAGGADTSNASDLVRPDGAIVPPMPEMEPAQIDNPTGTRLVQLVVGSDVLALFEDGSVYTWDYTANTKLELEQGYALKLAGFDGTVQLDVSTVLAETGTVGYWNYGPNFVPVVVQAIPGVDRAISLSQSCALIADGSVWCWSEPPDNAGIRTPPDHAAVKMGVPPAVEIASNLHSRCTLVRDGAGTVTRFRPALVGPPLQAIEVSALTLPSAAHRLFDGCAIPESGSPKCLWAGVIGQPKVNETCSEAQEYEIVATSSEHLTLASLGGNLRGCALGDSGQVYVTLANPDPASQTVNMDPLPGVSHAVFARAGEYVSCAVEPPLSSVGVTRVQTRSSPCPYSSQRTDASPSRGAPRARREQPGRGAAAVRACAPPSAASRRQSPASAP